jgi:hypothetical protein
MWGISFMNKSLTADMSSKESEFKAEIERMFRGMEREHSKMQKDQEEIDRLKAERSIASVRKTITSERNSSLD